MFQYSAIQTGLNGKVGFRQNEDPGGTQLPRLTTAEFFVNDFHSMLTFDNLKSIATDFDSMPGVANKPEALAAWCERRMNASLKRMLNEWKGRKMEGFSARSLIERQRLFRPSIGDGRLSPASTNFVGLEIVSTDSMSIAHKVERLGLQFDTNQNVRVYLFRDGTRDPISFVDVVYNSDGGVQWTTVNWLMLDGGKYFIGYDSGRVTGQAINGVDYEDHMGGTDVWTVGNHFSICGFDAETVDYTGGIGVEDVEDGFVVADDEVPQAGLTWKVGDITYNTSDNFGINLEMTSQCDYSSLVIGQGSEFAFPWALRTAIDLLRELVYNPNSNINRDTANAERMKTMLIYEIDGDPSSKVKTGLAADYENALAGVMFDSSDVDKVCMPCKKKGITFKAHG